MLQAWLAGLSWAPLAVSSQFTGSSLIVAKKFAICLPSTPSARGMIFLGDGPYYILPPTSLDAASILSYTPLLKRPKSSDYYIVVNDISINRLTIDSLGRGGVKISIVVRYAKLKSDIYRSFLKGFAKATEAIPRAKTVSPFGLCLKTSTMGFSRVGLTVPPVDVELANGKNWTIFGSNSMKQVASDVACLAFEDGGHKAKLAVVIGSFQIENNFSLFDLVRSRLGFSSSLFFVRTTCGNFNFTTKPKALITKKDRQYSLACILND
ncbi:hypothetical protein RJ639_013949 [Escallonia herrerae]|uniref:Peptidase A1 domain-containing protein n=1 Tax=Escallonia herrerae TaxID=1293975 RepID=A0AA89AML4_9ASTE|nr:hypothetical protein RJ639_013949 [Escallonia herrerae]